MSQASSSREEYILQRLTDVAAELTGFSTEAVSRDSVVRMMRDLLRKGRTHDQILTDLNPLAPWLRDALLQNVLVGETYFFRHPEHFRFLVDQGNALLKAPGPEPLRIWSAGCSSGEEAYSLAACVLSQVVPGRQVEVLGTDLSEQRLTLARQGSYGNWSRRESGPLLYPLFRSNDAPRVEVLDSIRAVTRFATHNLLEPPDYLGQFDIIFCRNVLVYFTRVGADLVRRYLARALKPGGYLVFGTMDVHRAPPGLVQVGQHGSQIFTRPKVAPAEQPKPAVAAPAPAPAPAPPALANGKPGAAHPVPANGKPSAAAPVPSNGTSNARPADVRAAPAPTPPPPEAAPNAVEADPWREYIEVHTEALSMIERGQHKDATRALSDLTR
ncbi:MAG TPA: CheR family methyltransferase, partial [Myxococcaceae bacterium]|nr:CheR family methyltransferase [Myxococcaceae bacterium]